MEKSTSKAFVETTGPIAGALAPTGEAGTPLFLINLCASMAPVQPATKSLPGLEAYRLYQVTRVEDGRTRYRLRLGFFPSDAEAEAVLLKVREQYPTAFTACLCEEDRRHTRGYVVPDRAAAPAMTIVPSPSSAPKAAAEPVAKKPATAQPTRTTGAPRNGASAAKAVPAKAPTASKPAAPAAPSSIEVARHAQKDAAPPAAKQATHKPQVAPKAQPTRGAAAPKTDAKQDTAASMRVEALDLTLSDPPPPPAQKTSTPSNQPFHVGKGVDIPTTHLSLQAESATTPSTKPAATKPAASPAAASRGANGAALKAPAAKPASTTPAAPTMAAPPKAAIQAKHPDLDSTQTIRALTAEELNDETQEKVFAIQLAASEQPVNLDAMPHLDIFEAYRLYSVATAGSGKIVHSLRLGFFKEALSAEAVAGYLKTFFSSPTVIRISVAEQARFKDATLPKKPAPVETKANVIELDSARSARVPTVTMEVVPGPDTSATGSFKMNATGSFRTSDTAKHRALPAGMKPAAKNASTPTKRSAPISRKKTATSGKYKSIQKKSLAEQLLEEAKEVELSESGIFRMQKSETSLLSRLVDKLKK
ncbi:MAG: hypothetical protein GX535_00745 [Xanthomonadaceae bacterium]|nr:hypothetical protein [Xanthomonadaceae bacterium]